MSPIKKMYLYGAGGHANVVSEVLKANGIEVLIVFDDNQDKTDRQSAGLDLRDEFPKLEYPLIVTIGDNATREKIVHRLNVEYGTGISPTALVSPSATIGEGTVVLQGAIIQANTKIGKHALINTGASVDHDNVIGDFAHISPKVTLCGHVEIGEGTHIGAGSTVIPMKKIGKWCTIGAGSVVISDIPDYCTAVGSPAKVIRQNSPLPQSCTNQSPDFFDLTMIGSGLASTMTLVQLVNQLEKNSPPQPIKVALVEQQSDFFGGLAYGQRAGNKSLIITSLEEFLGEPERANFKQWLSENKTWAFDRFRESGGEPSTAWLNDNALAIETNDWNHLFLPRYVFGLYLEHLGRRAIERGTSNNLIACQLIEARVDDTKLESDVFELVLRDAAGQSRQINSRQVVLATGSPPFSRAFPEKLYSPKLGGLFLQNLYQDSVSETLNRIEKHLQSKTYLEANLLLLGSNASTIEAIFNLCERPTLRDRVQKIIVVSPSGEFPCRNSPSSMPTIHFRPQALLELQQQPTFTAEQIFGAAKTDVFTGRKLGSSFSDSFEPISKQVYSLASRLNQEQQQLFVDHFGVEIGRYQRRAGKAYSDVVDKLIDSGKVEFIQGKFRQVAVHTPQGFKFDYVDSSGQAIRCHDWIQAGISCIGFEKINASCSSNLLSNLVRRKLAVVNGSGLGFNVDDDLQASKDLFLIGPLLGGNIIRGEMLWHAEHAGRIIRFAKQLAQFLTSGTSSDTATSIQATSNQATFDQLHSSDLYRAIVNKQ